RLLDGDLSGLLAFQDFVGKLCGTSIKQASVWTVTQEAAVIDKVTHAINDGNPKPCRDVDDALTKGNQERRFQDHDATCAGLSYFCKPAFHFIAGPDVADDNSLAALPGRHLQQRERHRGKRSIRFLERRHRTNARYKLVQQFKPFATQLGS